MKWIVYGILCGAIFVYKLQNWIIKVTKQQQQQQSPSPSNRHRQSCELNFVFFICKCTLPMIRVQFQPILISFVSALACSHAAPHVLICSCCFFSSQPFHGFDWLEGARANETFCLWENAHYVQQTTSTNKQIISNRTNTYSMPCAQDSILKSQQMTVRISWRTCNQQ